MKLLFDQNISFRVVDLIKANFPEARHVKDFELQYATDRQIWQFAKDNAFTIITFDSDFLDLVTLFGHPPKIIWLRLGNTSSKNLAAALIKQQVSIGNFIQAEDFKNVACLEINQ